MISFVGAGPGAPDLLTLRGADRLARADVVIWASSLVPEAVLERCRPGVELHDSKAMTLEDVVGVYAAHPSAAIVRLHSGDPTVYSAVAEQVDWCLAHERAFEIVPGVGSLSAAAAALGRELTVPGLAQSVVLTRLARRTAASMPPGEGVGAFAAHGSTMAVFLSASRPDELQAELLSVGSAYDPETPAVIAWRVSWPDERVLRTTVGPALAPGESPRRSHVYDPGYSHSFRSSRGGRSSRSGVSSWGDRSSQGGRPSPGDG
jgi:precorrin-4/cobalt-precorrin-4 C11-methyltransferase